MFHNSTRICCRYKLLSNRN